MGRCIGRRICFCLATQKPMLNLYSGTVSMAALKRVSLEAGQSQVFLKCPIYRKTGFYLLFLIPAF